MERVCLVDKGKRVVYRGGEEIEVVRQVVRGEGVGIEIYGKETKERRGLEEYEEEIGKLKIGRCKQANVEVKRVTWVNEDG